MPYGAATIKEQTMSGREERSRTLTCAGTAAAAWAFLFAALSFAWAAGARILERTLSDQIQALGERRSASFVAVLWGTGALKLALGALAVALVAGWGAGRARRLVLAGAWAGGVLLALYGGANLVVRALMALGVLATPTSMHSAAARWHLVLWDPWWLLGGVLFLTTACAATPRRRTDRRASRDRLDPLPVRIS